MDRLGCPSTCWARGENFIVFSYVALLENRTQIQEVRSYIESDG